MMENISKTTILLGGIMVVIAFLLGVIFTKSYLDRNQPTQSYPKTTLPQPTITEAQNPQPTPLSFEKAIDNNVLHSLSMIKKGILEKSILSNTYTGTVVKISTSGGYLPSANNFKFKLMIVIKNNQGEQNTFYYNDREFGLLNGNLDTLKPGDAITIKETIDLQKDQTENITALIITKL